MIVLHKRLEHLSLSDLHDHWEDVAWLCSAKRDPETGKLPRAYQEVYERVRDEFGRRGVQLSLFLD